MKKILLGAFGACLVVAGISTPAAAAVTSYVSRTAFETATAGFTGATVDFGSAAFGDTIASGDTFEGLTFTYTISDLTGAPLTMVIDDSFDTTSPVNYLGLTEEVSGSLVNFVTGDVFTIGFSTPVNAFGLNIISNFELIGGDSFALDGAGLTQSATLDGPAVPSSVLGDGGQVYFLGMVSDQAFSSVQFSSLSTDLEFIVDDLTYAVVPLPPALWLMAAGLMSFAGVARRARRIIKEP